MPEQAKKQKGTRRKGKRPKEAIILWEVLEKMDGHRETSRMAAASLKRIPRYGPGIYGPWKGTKRKEERRNKNES